MLDEPVRSWFVSAFLALHTSIKTAPRRRHAGQTAEVAPDVRRRGRSKSVDKAMEHYRNSSMNHRNPMNGGNARVLADLQFEKQSG